MMSSEQAKWTGSLQSLRVVIGRSVLQGGSSKCVAGGVSEVLPGLWTGPA